MVKVSFISYFISLFFSLIGIINLVWLCEWIILKIYETSLEKSSNTIVT